MRSLSDFFFFTCTAFLLFSFSFSSVKKIVSNFATEMHGDGSPGCYQLVVLLYFLRTLTSKNVQWGNTWRLPLQPTRPFVPGLPPLRTRATRQHKHPAPAPHPQELHNRLKRTTLRLRKPNFCFESEEISQTLFLCVVIVPIVLLKRNNRSII